MSQNVPGPERFSWNKRRLQAASLVAADELPDEQIAARCSVTRRQLTRWKDVPAFKAKVTEIRKAIADAILAKGIASKVERIAALQERWLKMRAVIAERAADKRMAKVPGGKTGLLAHRKRGLGSGDNFILVDEFQVDTGLLKAMLDAEAAAAKETELADVIQRLEAMEELEKKRGGR